MKLFVVQNEGLCDLYFKAESEEEAIEKFFVGIVSREDFAPTVKEVDSIETLISLIPEGEKEFRLDYDGSF